VAKHRSVQERAGTQTIAANEAARDLAGRAHAWDVNNNMPTQQKRAATQQQGAATTGMPGAQ